MPETISSRFVNDFDEAVRRGSREQKPLFVWFSYHGGPPDNSAFTFQANRRLIQSRFVEVELFTGHLPGVPDALSRRMVQRSEQLQLAWFDEVVVPAFAIVSPDGKTVLSKLIGSDDRDAFVKFLDEGWAKWQELAGQGKLTEREVGMTK